MMVWITDPSGAVTFVNRKWLSFTGRRLKEELGDGWLISVHPDDLSPCLNQFLEALRNRRPFTMEYRLRRSDGLYRWISDSGLPLHEENGSFAGYVGTSVDITEQRGGRGVLERTVEHLRLVAANADEMIYRLRLSEPPHVEYMSPGVARIVGVSPEEFLRAPDIALERIHPDDRDRLKEMLNAPPDPTARVTLRWRHPGGRLVWAEHRRLPVFDSDGNLVAIDGVATDITRQKELELERDAQIALLDALIAHMHDGVLAETDDGRVAVVNAAFCRIFGLPHVRPPSGAGSLIPKVRALLSQPLLWSPRRSAGETRDTELHLTDGRIIEHQYFPVRPDDGRVIHMWQFRDVTARHQAEQELIASRHRLRDLTSHLQSAREEERRELARELHDELGQLLTGVRLEVASAIEKFNSTRTSQDFAVVDRLQGTVGLVDLSIATIRRITTALRPPALDHLGVMSAIRWEAALFERRTGIRCRVSSRPATFETRAHVTVLYRILLEALTNVARHANAGTVRIAVRQGTRHLTMEVRDNGKGISEEVVANPTTLGLLGMRERALAAGGDVRIARLAAGGTSVVVTLPHEPTPSESGARPADA